MKKLVKWSFIESCSLEALIISLIEDKYDKANGTINVKKGFKIEIGKDILLNATENLHFVFGILVYRLIVFIII